MKQMLYLTIASLLITTTILPSQDILYRPSCPLRNKVDADWLIVGAGPAGIATIGILLDVGIPSHRITWIDPEFAIGRIGAHYQYVTANGKTGLFVKFLDTCNAFKECSSESITALRNLDPEGFHELHVVIEPLRDITAYLRTKVQSVQTCMKSLFFSDDAWTIITSSNESITAHNVVLATGSHPAILNYEKEKIIPLDVALNPHTLEKILTPDDSVGVVGNSHSGILLLMFLSELSFKLKHIYNIYRSPIAYSNGGQADGIRGTAAEWAQNVLEKNPPANLTSIQVTADTIESVLAECTKVIYAIGYEQNELPLINNTTPITQTECGMIAPRLFGIGIAFPEKITFPNGDEGNCIGVNCFINYAQKIIPEWINADMIERRPEEITHLNQLDNLFRIIVL